MENNKSSKIRIEGPNMSFYSILGIVFIVLKLTKVIEWSWIWVLSPFWLPYTIFFIVAFIVIMVIKQIKIN